MSNAIELAKQSGIRWDAESDCSEWRLRRSELEALVALVRNAALGKAAEVCFRNAALTPCPIDNARMLECGASIRNLKEPTHD